MNEQTCCFADKDCKPLLINYGVVMKPVSVPGQINLHE